MTDIKKRIDYKHLVDQHLKILKSLEYNSGLFAASSKNRKKDTGYDKAWLRDNFYECMAFVIIDDWDTIKKTYRAILNIFIKHEKKIDCAIAEKPEHRYQYIHARYHPETFEEFWEEWGNKQNDSIGCMLWIIGELEHHKGIKILKTKDDYRIIQKLVHYLESIEYWHDKDSGMWEEDEEVHASSVGACVAGLKSIKRVKKIKVSPSLISKGMKTLKHLLPRESKNKFVDLSLLSLIYPYNIVTKKQRDSILKNIEYLLVRRLGVIRYKNDHYYNKNIDKYSEEAEWTMGLSWLSIIYGLIGNKKKERIYLERSMSTMTKKGIPELYFSNSPKHNENNPLGWSESLLIVAIYTMNKKFTGHGK